MIKSSLRSRLFYAHLTVLGIGIITLAIVGWIYSPNSLQLYLRRIEGVNLVVIQRVRPELIEAFRYAWKRSMIWAVLIGGVAASTMSYWLSQRIVQPLLEIKDITRRFAAGNFEHRLPKYDIVELNQLADGVNQMATDLQNVEQRRRDLVSDLSHELRTPLTILRGYLEGLADNTIPADAGVYHRLAQETTRLERLARDLQELSQLESGYLPIEAGPIALCPLLSAIVSRFADQRLPEDPVQLKLQCPSDLPQVQADRGRIEQVVVNLLSNGLRHTQAGYVEVSAWQAQQRVWIAVKDTGSGISPQDMGHIFERFWRGDGSRDRAMGGTGIGLTICRRLIELHGGSIEVESKLGQGSIFRFWLPVAAGDVPPQPTGYPQKKTEPQ